MVYLKPIAEAMSESEHNKNFKTLQKIGFQFGLILLRNTELGTYLCMYLEHQHRTETNQGKQ